MQTRLKVIVCALTFSAITFISGNDLIAKPQQSAAPEKLGDGIVVRFGDSLLKVEVCTESVIHVAYARDSAFFTRQSQAAAPKRCETVPWNLTRRQNEAVLSTTRLKVKVD